MTILSATRGAPATSEIRNNLALSMAGTSELEDAETVLTNIDNAVADSLAQQTVLFHSDNNFTFTGTALTYSTTGLEIRVVHNSTGSVFTYTIPTGETLNFSSDGDILYAVLARDGSGTGTVPSTDLTISNNNLVSGATSLATQASANIWHVPIAMRIDASGTNLLHWFFGHGAWTSSTASKIGVASGSGSGMTDPMTTRGDVIYRNPSNTTARLAAGTDGQILTSDGTDVSWEDNDKLEDPLTTRGDIIYRNATVTTRLPVGTDGQVLTSDGTDVAWQTPAAGSGGGGTGGDDSDFLDDAELGLETPTVPNQIINTFNDDKGTNVDMSEVGSALVLDAGETSGTHQISKKTGNTLQNVQGKFVVSLHATAPKEITGTTTKTVKLRGNLVSVFPNGKDVVFLEKLEQLGKTDHLGLFDADNILIRLAVSATPTYDAPTDVTTVLVSDADDNEVDFGYSTEADLLDHVRMCPFDLKFEVSSTGVGNLQEMDIKALEGRDNIRISGSNFTEVIESLDGSIDFLIAKASPNKQYMVAEVLVNDGVADDYHWIYSKDGGNTWTKMSSTRSMGYNTSPDNGGTFYSIHRNQLVVADNGKWFCAFPDVTAYVKAMGVYGDLTDATPDISNVPDHGDGAGVISVGSSIHEYVQVAADLTDLSFVAAGIGVNVAAGTFEFRAYTDGGETYDGLSDGYNNLDATAPKVFLVSGSGSSHKVHIVYAHDSDGNVYAKYWDQSDYTTTFSTYVSGNPVGNINGWQIVDGMIDETNNHFIWCAAKSGGSATVDLNYVDIDSPSTAEVTRTLWNTGNNHYDGGYNTTSASNNFRHIGNRLLADPSDPKHLYLVLGVEATRGSTHLRSVLMEVIDYTAGAVLDTALQLTDLGTYVWTGHTGNKKASQEFSLSSQKARCMAVAGKRVGVRAADDYLKAAIYTDSSGVPGSLVETSPTQYRINDISSSENAFLPFNFSNTERSGTFHLVLETSSGTYDGSNYMGFGAGGTGGGMGYLNSSDVWTQVAVDMNFQLFTGAYIYDFGNKAGAEDFECVESTIALKDNGNIRWVVRQPFIASVDLYRFAGNVLERNIALPSTDEPSVIGDVGSAMYDDKDDQPNFNDNLRLSVALGTDECKGINQVTGDLSGDGVYDRSGSGVYFTESSLPTEVPDANFASGKAIALSRASEHYILYHNASPYGGHIAVPRNGEQFYAEAEIHPTTVSSGNRCILSAIYLTGTYHGWRFRFNGSGYLEFGHFDGTAASFTTTASDKVEPTTYHRVAVMGNAGENITLWRKEPGVDGGNGTGEWYEIGSGNYSSQASLPASGNGISANSACRIGIGCADNSTSSGYQEGDFFDGKIGHIQIIIGDSFTTPNDAPQQFLNQPSMNSINNLGSCVVGKRISGQIDNNDASNAHASGVRVKQGGFVDSYDLYLVAEKQLSSSGGDLVHKQTIGRGSDENQTQEQGYVLKFTE